MNLLLAHILFNAFGALHVAVLMCVVLDNEKLATKLCLGLLLGWMVTLLIAL